jgi:hypothetical protein
MSLPLVSHLLPSPKQSLPGLDSQGKTSTTGNMNIDQTFDDVKGLFWYNVIVWLF